jgi:hypothetical protein
LLLSSDTNAVSTLENLMVQSNMPRTPKNAKRSYETNQNNNREKDLCESRQRECTAKSTTTVRASTFLSTSDQRRQQVPVGVAKSSSCSAWCVRNSHHSTSPMPTRPTSVHLTTALLEHCMRHAGSMWRVGKLELKGNMSLALTKRHGRF